MIGMICYQSYRESSAVESAQNISISEEQIILQGKKKGRESHVLRIICTLHSINYLLIKFEFGSPILRYQHLVTHGY